MIPRPGATESATRETRWQKRRREFSESEELTQRNPSLNVSRTGNGGKTAWSSPRRASVAELDKDSKRTRLSLSSRSQEVSGPIEALDFSRAPHPHCVEPAPITATGPNTDTIIIPDDSDAAEKQQRKSTAESANDVSKYTNIGLGSTTQEKDVGIKDEPLSPDITSRIKLRVKADGPGVKARGPITAGFEVYKTSERLFTSLMSERSLKPETQKKVSQLTVTINGKETCCRRNRFDDWMEVCGELRRLWDNRPELFNDRFEVDVMLHVDE